MPPPKQKKPFGWQPGDKLDNETYDPLGHVRDTGFTKLADGVYADPELRKKERKRALTSPRPKKDLVIDESVSGLSNDFTPSEASKVMGKKGGPFKGVFGTQEKKNPKK